MASRIASNRRRWSVTLPTPAGLEEGGVCDDEEESIFFNDDGVRCEITFNVQPQNDGSVRVTSTTLVIVDGVDGDSIDFDVFIHDDRLTLIACCPEPEEQDGEDPVAGGTRRTLVDASGHPGFHRQQDTLVPNFDLVTAGVSAGDSPASGSIPARSPGTGSWACSQLPTGQQYRWLFGDGAISKPAAGTPGPATHIYPTSNASDDFLGVLVLLGGNCSDDTSRSCDVLEKEYFRVNT